MHAYAGTRTQRTPGAEAGAVARRPAGGAMRGPADDATGRLARALDGSPAVAATQRLQRSLAGGFTPALAQRHTGPAVIQRAKGDPLDAETLKKVHAIARRAGVDPTKLRFAQSGEDHSQSIDDQIFLGDSLTDDQLEFVLGHELSHYKTGDNRNFPFSTIALASLIGAGISTAALGPLAGLLAGGALGFGAEYVAGGGLLNALITGASTGGLLGLGPLGATIGGALGGLVGGGGLGGLLGGGVGALAGGAFGLPIVSKLFEFKADLHSASTFGTKGGISRFQKQFDEPSGDTDIFQKGNAWLDPFHPPLSTRVAYLKALHKVFGW